MSDKIIDPKTQAAFAKRTEEIRALLMDTAPVEGSTMNALELTSISSLLSFAAYDLQISEASVLKAVTSHFSVQKVQHISREFYDDVIRFLVDFQLDMLVN